MEKETVLDNLLNLTKRLRNAKLLEDDGPLLFPDIKKQVSDSDSSSSSFNEPLGIMPPVLDIELIQNQAHAQIKIPMIGNKPVFLIEESATRRVFGVFSSFLDCYVSVKIAVNKKHIDLCKGDFLYAKLFREKSPKSPLFPKIFSNRACEVDNGVIIYEFWYSNLDSIADRKFARHIFEENFCQIADAIAELHELGYYHYNLKESNLLIGPNNRLRIRDSDYLCKKSDPEISKQRRGTPHYMPPEGFSNPFWGTFYEKVDVWSLGMILMGLCLGENPLKHYGVVQKLEEYMGLIQSDPQQWENDVLSRLDKDYRTLASGMCQVDPQKRLTIAEAKEMFRSTIEKSRHSSGPIAFPEEREVPGQHIEMQSLANKLTNIRNILRDAKFYKTGGYLFPELLEKAKNLAQAPNPGIDYSIDSSSETIVVSVRTTTPSLIGDKPIIVLGEGAEGVVYGIFSEYLKKYVAVKISTKLPKLNEGEYLYSQLYRDGELKSPAFLDVFSDEAFESKHNVFIYELCRYGDLHSLTEMKSMDGWTHALTLLEENLCQIIGALVELSGLNCCHHDLKLRNLLIGPNNTIKIADYGFMKKYPVYSPEKILVGSLRGTPNYMAPELFFQGSDFDNHKVDIWSLGVIFIELLTKQCPFKEYMGNREKLRGYMGDILRLPHMWEEKVETWLSGKSSKEGLPRNILEGRQRLVTIMCNTNYGIRPTAEGLLREYKNIYEPGYIVWKKERNNQLEPLVEGQKLPSEAMEDIMKSKLEDNKLINILKRILEGEALVILENTVRNKMKEYREKEVRRIMVEGNRSKIKVEKNNGTKAGGKKKEGGKEEENEEENEDTLELTVRDRIDIVLESYLETGNSIIEVKGCDEKITHITTKSAENYVKEEEGAEGVGEPKSSSDDPEKRENAHKLTVPGAEGPTENYVKEEEAGESEKLKSFPDDSEEEEDAHDLTVLDAEKLTGNCAKEGGETERFKKPESSSDALERHHAASEELSSIPLQGQTADSTGKKKTNGSKKKLTPFGCLLF